MTLPATLPGLASQAASNPPSLTALLSSVDGYTKASTVFTAATLPDFATVIADPTLITPAGDLYVVQQNSAGSFQPFLNSSSQHGSFAMRGGWFVSTDPVNGPTLVGGVDFIDWDGAARFASPVGPFQFLVQRLGPALSTDNVCPGVASNNNLSTGVVPSQCYSYVTNALQMQDWNGNHISVEAITTRSLTSSTVLDFPPNVARAYQLAFSPMVNDVPCTLTQTGALPNGVTYTSGSISFSGTATLAQGGGVFTQNFTETCGGINGLSTSFSIRLNIGTTTNVSFTSSANLSATSGLPVNFTVTTTGSPSPTFTSYVPLPDGWTFQDNGNGTATISGRTFDSNPPPCLRLNSNFQPDCPILASNGLTSASQYLTISLAPYPHPLSFTAPPLNSTLNFLAGMPSSYIVQTIGGQDGPIRIQLSPPNGVQTPSWLNLHDNGDGTAIISGTPPLDAPGFSVPVSATAFWCCGFNTGGGTWTVSVTAPRPQLFVNAGDSAVYLAGTAGTTNLYSNIQAGTGSIVLTGKLPPGLQYVDTISNDASCLIDPGNCPTTGAITGTPQPGSAGHYAVTFTLTSPGGTDTQSLDLVVYEKPGLASSSRIILYAGVPTNPPSSAVVSAAGYPLAPVGPFADGIGYSGGLTFSDPFKTIPPVVRLISGLNGVPNGTATLISNAPPGFYGIYPIILNMQENAAPAPVLPNPGVQLGNNYQMNLYLVPPGDVNLDFVVNCADLSAVKAGFGKVKGMAGYDDALDVNHDGVINVKDLAWVASKLPTGMVCN